MISPEKMPHAVLLCGGTMEKKWQIVSEKIQQLLPSCSFIHPDLLLLPDEEKEKENAALTIDSIRRAIVHLQRSSHQGGNKIVVLKNIDALSFGASHALLKILEEPPPNSYLFLMCEYAYLLPLTLRSRCQRIFLPAEKKPIAFIQELNDTLTAVKQGKLCIFKAAQQWQGKNFLAVLDGLFYCFLMHTDWRQKEFEWVDILNDTRRQVLNRQNPNHLLALEYIFYLWSQE